MESIWPENRIRAGLPFMAHTLCGHGEAGFKPGNKLNDFIEPSSRTSSRDHRAAPSTRTWLRTAARCGVRPLRTASRRPGSGSDATGNDSSSPAATALHSIPLRDPRIGQEP
jgi:hypothetical protein